MRFGFANLKFQVEKEASVWVFKVYIVNEIIDRWYFWIAKVWFQNVLVESDKGLGLIAWGII